MEDYTDEERSIISRDSKNYFATNEQDIIDFINNNIVKRNPVYKRLYCGKISGEIGNRIESDTGINLSGISIVIDSVFENSHVDSEKENKRGQQAITPEIIAKLPKAIANYESVSYEGGAKDGREVFLFIVDIEGEKRAVEYYSKAKKILTLQTLYGWKNRKSLSVTSDAIAPDRTPKTTNGFNSSVDIISTEGENGNSSQKVHSSISPRTRPRNGNRA